jgi:(p)ppGpp synthase/HD superfamily hydrolase
MLTARFSEALVFAANLHRNQVRKGPKRVPYIGHLLAVAGVVIDFGGSEDEVIAALLHDAVEDQGGHSTREIISRMFGEPVADIVDSCSDTDQVPKPPWQDRKRTYLAHLRAAPVSALLVSAADKLVNARSLLADLRQDGDDVWSRFTATPAQLLWYYRAIVETLQASLVDQTLVEELNIAVTEIERELAPYARKAAEQGKSNDPLLRT